jgi:GT2 family glycosyltransferase
MNKEELANERVQARAVKDFAKADHLRDQIAALGFEVIDVAGGYEFRPIEAFPTYASTKEIKPVSLNSEIAVAIIVDGFISDAIDTVKSIKANTSTPILLLCLQEPAELTTLIDAQTKLIVVKENFGWGESANSLLKAISTKYVVLMDPSTRFTGDAVAPVLESLKAGTYAAVGWRGGLVNIEDEWRSVDDKGEGEVDVLFSYFIALNREEALEAGGFNSRAIFYRNADIEFSLKLRHTGGRLLQMELPLEQARHHGYYDSDPEFREIQSKKNYDRILERFRGKSAILSPRR